MKRTMILMASTLIAGLLLASPVSAHQKAGQVDLPTGETLYYYTDHGHTAVFQETNGKTDEGVWSSADGTGETGLQIHDVCYGTFTEADVAAWNEEHVGYIVLAYVPFHGTAADCAASDGSFVEADTLVAGEPRDYEGGGH